MKKIGLLLLFIVLSLAVKSQERKFIIRDMASIHKTTEIAVDDYELKKAITVYDLVLNLSYFHHISHDLDGHLTLPSVTIDNKLVFDNKLKEIPIADVLDYQFESGRKTQALYGTRGKYGHLIITLK